MLTEEQKILGELYNLEESLSDNLIKQEMYEEIRTLRLIIEKLEYRIINKVGTIGI